VKVPPDVLKETHHHVQQMVPLDLVLSLSLSLAQTITNGRSSITEAFRVVVSSVVVKSMNGVVAAWP